MIFDDMYFRIYYFPGDDAKVSTVKPKKYNIMWFQNAFDLIHKYYLL